MVGGWGEVRPIEKEEKRGSRLLKNVTVKSTRQAPMAVSSSSVSDSQNCHKKKLGYIFNSLCAHDWNKPTKLWKWERSVIYSEVLSSMLWEWEPDWHDQEHRWVQGSTAESKCCEKKVNRLVWQSALEWIRIVSAARRSQRKGKSRQYVSENGMSSQRGS